MIPKSGNRFSEKIMLKQKAKRDFRLKLFRINTRADQEIIHAAKWEPPRHDAGSAGGALRPALWPGDRQRDRSRQCAVSEIRRGGAVLCARHQRPRRARLFAAR